MSEARPRFSLSCPSMRCVAGSRTASTWSKGYIDSLTCRRFRKACSRRFRSQELGLQPFRRNARTCLEGPFGEVLRKTGAMAKANPFRFSSKYQDDETDLVYYGYRYYNASTGRWLSRDPIEELRHWLWKDRPGLSTEMENCYRFVGNNPVQHLDATGLFIWGSRCSPEKIDEIKNAFRERWRRARKNNCFNVCKFDAKGRCGIMEDCISKDGEGPRVECDDSSNPRCNVTSEGFPCGYTDKRGDRTIHLCLNAGSDVCKGGPGCTLLHEVAHRDGGVGPDDRTTDPDNRAYDLERCAGCK